MTYWCAFAHKRQHLLKDILKEPTSFKKHIDRGDHDYMDGGTISGEDHGYFVNVSIFLKLVFIFASSTFSGRKDQVVCGRQSRSHCCIQGVHGEVSN